MNYYNEFDPGAAAWLRELIAEKHIPAGHVDIRSICDVQPSDLDGFTQCHFFAGIGGWPLALDLAGRPHNRPVWTGSCPCQPFSVAGKQSGNADARHLWPDMFRLIRKRQPPAIFGEQVEAAIRFGWLDGIFADLEGEDYACGAIVLGAHSVHAPHIRQRLWWVADAAGVRCPEHVNNARGREKGGADHPPKCGGARGLADSFGSGRQGEDGSGESGDSAGEGACPLNSGRDGNASLWADSAPILCRDGKYRRIPTGIKSGVLFMADGFFYRMADVLSEIDSQTIQEVIDHAKIAGCRPDEVLLAVRNRYPSQAIQWKASGQNGFPAPEVLFAFLRSLTPTLHRSADSSCCKEKSAQNGLAEMRDLRKLVSDQCSSYRRESKEQFSGQSSSPMSQLSWFLARCCQARRDFEAGEDAAHFPLIGKVTGRVGLLRGAGNAIIAEEAAEFIKAVMESL